MGKLQGGGTRFDWIGYHFDLEMRVAGISDSRSAWVQKWCAGLVRDKAVCIRDFVAALGRVGHAAEILPYVKPFLGPLYAWHSNMAPGTATAIPVMVIMVLSWLEEKFAQKLRTPFGLPVVQRGELYRSDAKAHGAGHRYWGMGAGMGATLRWGAAGSH